MTFSPGPSLRAALDASGPINDAFAAAGHRLYLVGGVVRDDLVGRARSDADYDLTTDALPATTRDLVAPFADAVWTQGERFGTIGARVGGHDFEITTHRADSYEAASRKPLVAFGDRIEDDLARRDFTVNAMAVSCDDGSLVDPFGGASDLAAGVLRTPLAPEIAFHDDPLRMLRAARFVATFGFRPESDLVAAVEAMGERMEIVSAERVRDELAKTLLLPDPAPGFAFLVATGLLARVLPGLASASSDPVQAAVRAGRAGPDLAARWAALLLDLDDSGRLDELAGLKPSGGLLARSVWLGSVGDWLEGPVPDDEPSLRRAAAAAPSAAPLEHLLDFVAAVRDPSHTGADLVAARTTLAGLRAAEPDLDSPELPIDGLVIAAVLGVDPGPAVGEAVSYLREQRFERGPFDAVTATRLLRDRS